MATFPALQPYIDRGLLLALLHQDALVEATTALGPHRWDVDMQAGTLTFASESDPARTLTTKAQLVASIAPGPRSILWGWAHPQGHAEGSVAGLRRQGEKDDVRELREAELPLPETVNASDGDALAAIAHELGQTATGILGAGPYYSAPVEGGTRIVFLLDAPLPELTLATTVIKLPRLLSTGLFRDARTSVWGLATAKGWTFRWSDDQYLGADLSDGSSSAHLTFNAQGQITGVQASASA
ncbi:DUF6882 domain-containing protein [Microbacterium gorillae]|uniref:DUF6882 domain-containing protein n=1 Tax=Microbacterium gorillae TaxID=1231063 RepID=UPI00058DF25F|nr:DUF6882 domain-containing protein [Microbacterium gorillae]